MNQNSTTASAKPVTAPRLAIRTNLRAGVACNGQDNQAKAIWDKIKGTISNVTSPATNSATDTTSSSTPA